MVADIQVSEIYTTIEGEEELAVIYREMLLDLADSTSFKQRQT